MTSRSEDLYALLGLSPAASAGQLRKAYTWAMQVERSPTRLADIQCAYAVLGDPGRRSEYDRGRTVGVGSHRLFAKRRAAGAGWGAGWGRARWLQWRVAVAATALNGVVVGYGAVLFQLFGERADRADYLTSAGGYLGAALVLALAPLTLLSPTHRCWGGSVCSWWAGAAALLLAVLGLSSLGTGLGMDQPTGPFAGLNDGLGGVVLWPWCWLLLWGAGRGICDRVRAR